ncbi:MAG: MarR family transcriptional regulator [Clostridiales bacterium]|nr:MAG: MarR family transcriptional regulator [Clostridiales bacterium]
MKKYDNELNTFFIRTFNKILNSEERTLQRSKIPDLSVKELHIIEAVGLLEPEKKSTMSNLAVNVGISVGALTTAVNAIVRKGYLTRAGDENDRRKVYIFLTESGKKAFLLHEKYHKNMINGITSVLTEPELDTLIKSLATLSEFFENTKL